MHRVLIVLSLALFLLPACEEEADVILRSTCEVAIDAIEPDRGPVEGGSEATLSGLWLVSDLGVRDTLVHVGGVEAEVLEAVRGDSCGPCDSCLAEAQLRCGECTRICRGLAPYVAADGTESALETCTDTVVITLPAAEEAGEATVALTTSRGAATGPVYVYEADAAAR